MRLTTPLALSFLGTGTAIVGGALNFLVMGLNGRRMPVFGPMCTNWPGWPLDARHACASGATRLAGLADWIHVGSWIYSPGDILLALGQGAVLGALAALVLFVVISRGK